ncbi:unnamed protein product [Prorocentrum cordatum]|uniref:Endonuclease/exonuclease/phosphatase domain-containing protein n=1 Tax=Prorocentrum cordatum TaxID=2364126 RepID=A0ABN9YFZ2_9DINO|nr:unnamed protein product [Polarella glacialis]
MCLNIGCAFPLYVCSVYLTTSIGLSGENLDHLEGIMAFVGGLQGPWLLIGDWNMLPTDLEAWAKHAKGRLLSAQVPTCAGREIDFGIVSNALAPFVSKVEAVMGSTAKTHVPLAITFGGLHRGATVTRAVYPKRFPIEKPLPVRPAPVEAHLDEWTWQVGQELPDNLGEACQCWLDHVETYLIDLHDIQPWCQRSWSGRSSGLRVVHVPFETAWKQDVREGSSLEYRQWSSYLSAFMRLHAIGFSMKEKGLSSLAACRCQL